MKFIKIPILLLTLSLLASNLFAQKTEITISFSEQFFDALLDAIFQYAAPPEFPLSENRLRNVSTASVGNSFAARLPCNESIKLLRESNGVRTAVKFRDGRIYAPIAFSGNYNPPFVGCVPFAGLADGVIDLEFDQPGQRLLARVRVQNVSLNGTGGVGGALVARMVQSSIDKKINPIEIIRTDKVSFVLPLQNSNSVRMRATGFTPEIANGQLNIRVAYEFERSR
jgi:hypothetical protein